MSGATREQLLDAISAAMRAHDMPAVVALLHPLAVVAPDDAALILATIRTPS